MRLLMIGDIVGKPGRQIVVRALPALRWKEQIDLVVANAENSAGGSGMTPSNYRELVMAGVDVVTMGDHVYRRREIFGILNQENNIVRPANYPHEAPGPDHIVVRTSSRTQVAVFACLGRVFMSPVDCPYRAADSVLRQLPDDVRVIVMDYHAEATSDMQLMGRYLDGRVTAVLGTHTHVPTADECILPDGTAFQCDVGMTGPHESILGRRIDRVMETATTFRPTHFEVATDDVRLHGILVEADAVSGKATSVRRIAVDQREADRLASAYEKRAQRTDVPAG